jgi:hypothetical protein
VNGENAEGRRLMAEWLKAEGRRLKAVMLKPKKKTG